MEWFILLFGLLGWYSTTGIKTQIVRLVDVFFYGPILIYIGMRTKENWEKIILYLLGASTITYNLRNYIKN